jgi:uracil-DNA glycosylase
MFDILEFFPTRWRGILDNKNNTIYLLDCISNLNKNLNNEEEIFGDDLKIFPPKEKIFYALECSPILDTKVVIIGQDPYHREGQAMGLSFSVPKGISIPPSLQNIYKELRNNIDGFVIPNHGNLEKWAKQGVLLLNSTLTVREASPMSHAKIWKDFSEILLQYLSDKTSNLVFLLWGEHSRSKKKFIDCEKHHILECVHPSPLSANRGGWFGNKHFSKCNNLLKEMGKTEINWSLD